MAFEPHPWFIGLEGVEHSAEVARTLAWAATNGATGVIRPNDLKVRAQTVPDGSVRIAPGGFVVESKYAGADQQSYIERVPTETSVEVPATGSSGGATRYVVARVNDPDYPGGGAIPPVPNDATYAAPYVVSSLSSTRTEVVLAKITQPANTAAITNSMITDMRVVANPRTWVVDRSDPLELADVETLTSTSTGERFPNGGGMQLIDIPKDATRCIVEAEWLQINEPGGEAYGKCWIEWGPLVSGSTTEREYSTQKFMWNTPGSGGSSRNIWKVSQEMWVPAAVRGTEQIFSMRAVLDYASSSAARPKMDQWSGITFKVTFQEMADWSSS